LNEEPPWVAVGVTNQDTAVGPYRDRGTLNTSAFAVDSETQLFEEDSPGS
jgi:hypothetical protein